MNRLFKFLCCFLIISVSWNVLAQDNSSATDAEQVEKVPVRETVEVNENNGVKQLEIQKEMTVIKPTQYRTGPVATTTPKKSSQSSLTTGSGNKHFDNAFNKLYLTFTNSRVVVYVLGAFGLLGFAVATIFGKLSWLWLTIIAISLFILASAESIVSYAVRAGNSTPKVMTAGWVSSQFNNGDSGQLQLRDDSADFNYEKMLETGSKVKIK